MRKIKEYGDGKENCLGIVYILLSAYLKRKNKMVFLRTVTVISCNMIGNGIHSRKKSK